MSIILKRTKILSTIGPATHSQELVEQMILAGTNGFRINFSHGDNDGRDQQIAWIRAASTKLDKPVAILQDLQGPKIRLGTLQNNRLDVKKGDVLTLDCQAEHDGGLTLPVQYNLAPKVKVGQALYLFDGKIKTDIIEVTSDTAIKVRVNNDGFLMSKKGLNLPDTDFGGDILTAKDLQDIKFGATRDLDYVALSFVQSAHDIIHLRQLLTDLGSTAKIIAKVETKAAIRPGVLEEIIEASDGIMIARGDLAVEAGAEVVPIIQRHIIAECRHRGKLSIVATQMMASMVDNPEPTRAEVGDLATAVILGADTVMLSDETANGSYPLETVAAMKRVILYTQQNSDMIPIHDIEPDVDDRKSNAISAATVILAEHMGAQAIVAETKSGATAISISANRPTLPIVTVTSDQRVCQQLTLYYGTKCFMHPDSGEPGLELVRTIKKAGFFGPVDQIEVVIVSGQQPGIIGTTDTIRFRIIE